MTLLIVIGFLLKIIITITSLPQDIKPSTQYPWFSSLPFNKTKITNGLQWMKDIPSSINISALTIPGSHDSCTYSIKDNFNMIQHIIDFYSQTQVWNLNEQLAAGIRFFDIRVGTDGNIYHGKIMTSDTFITVLQTIKQFLVMNPTEGIIMRLQKNIKYNCNTEKCIQDNIYKRLDEYRNIFFLSNEIPLMKNLRAKIFLLLEDLEYRNAMSWTSEIIKLQDSFLMIGEPNYQITKKKKVIQEYLNKGKKRVEFIINHCSGAGFPFLSIKTVAINENRIPFEDTNFSGIISMDFPSEELVQHLINQNDFNKEKILAKPKPEKYNQKPFLFFDE